MGKRGPRKGPTVLTVLKGNPGKRRVNRNEPKPEPIAPTCPEWLNEDAREEWNRVAPQLEQMGLLTKMDMAALAAYCQAYARWVEAERVISKHGMVFKTPSGYMQQLPHVGIAHKSMLIMRGFCQEFGLTPSARSGMQLPGNEGATLDALLS